MERTAKGLGRARSARRTSLVLTVEILGVRMAGGTGREGQGQEGLTRLSDTAVDPIPLSLRVALRVMPARQGDTQQPETAMDDDKVAADDNRRVAQYEATASDIEEDVNADVAQRAEKGSAAESGRLDQVAGDMRTHAIDEVAGQGREMSRGRLFARISQVTDYLFSILYGLLAIRLVLALLAANPSNGFVRLINGVTEPFYALFRGILASPSAEGHTLVVPILVAMAAYALLHGAIKGLLRMVVHRQTAV